MNAHAGALVVLIAIAATPALACKCGWTGPLDHTAIDKTVVVVHVDEHLWSTDRRSIPAVRATVLDVWTGKAPATLKLLTDRGADCRISAGVLTTGQRYVVVLGDTEGDARPVSACGEYVVPIQDGVAVGKLTSASRQPSSTADDPMRRSPSKYNDTRMPLSALRKHIVAHATTGGSP